MASIKKTAAVMGATGKVGGAVAAQLLSAGWAVRGIGRDPGKLRKLATWGEQPYSVSFDDPKRLADAFRDVDAVFTMIPPEYSARFERFQDEAGEATAKAIEAAKVRYVVNLSSIGAHLSSGTGPVKGLYRQELRLNASKATVVHLRPNYFMENLLFSIPTIKQLGINGSPIRADLPMPMVATRDVGAKAAELIMNPVADRRAVVEYCGPRPVTLEEVTRIIGRSIAKPDLRYVQFSYADAEKAMLASGMQREVVALMLEMNRGFNDGLIVPTQAVTDANRGTSTVEEFIANVFAPAYQAERLAPTG